MRRREFVLSSLLGTLAFGIKASGSTPAPSLFIGHGSPMNAIEKNEYSKAQIELGKTFTKPKAILIISAHWETNGLYIQNSPHPEIIHDFIGFPKELQEFKYNGHGSKEFTKIVSTELKNHHPELTQKWGLDHGAWSVLTRLFPNGDIPVFQMSINQNFNLLQHLEMARELKTLRDRGLMIIGSGNLVHNLNALGNPYQKAPYDWALEFDEWAQKVLFNRDYKSLASFTSLKKSIVDSAHPTLEHYIPLLYAVGASTSRDKQTFPISGFQENSISMKSVLFT
jgi:4,5-DOPA dioxygenase extradiol